MIFDCVFGNSMYSCLLTKRWVCCSVLCALFVFSDGFNLDTDFPILFKSAPENYFGYSVALHRNRDGPIALVGAPRANSSVYRDQVYQPGVLFSCEISFAKPSQECKEVLLDKKAKQSLIPPGVYYYAFGQVGMSAAYSEDGKQLLIGAPGFYDWTGTILSYSLDPNRYNDYTTPIVPESPEDQSLSPEPYIGYSITSGNFFNNNETFVAVGAPRDGNSHGRVYIFKPLKHTAKKLFVHQRKEGLQLGEYFGSSVLAINLNNDAYSDLLIGAPLASSDSGGDEGKVYVYISNGMGLQIFAQLFGENKPNARFGMAIADVGDLNQDGFNDVAIGAPYEDQTGVVYIYQGARQGIKTQYIQRISARNIKSSLSGFGIQISRGLDIDNNQYPDILIGAYTSSEAVLFRTKPVIQISSKLSFSPQQINKDVTLCEYESQPVSCVNITYCLNYAGKHVPLTLEFDNDISLEHASETSIMSPRGFFLKDGKQTTILSHREELNIGMDNCLTETLYIPNKIKDWITPIQVFYNYELVEERSKASGFCKTCPIVDAFSASNLTKSISFQTGCGSDDECLADLVLKARIRDNPNNNVFIIGQFESLILDIDIRNVGEPAYLAVLLIHLPPETPIINPDFCSQLSDEQRQRSNASLICDIGNPLLKDIPVKIQIKIDISKLKTDNKAIDLLLEASTASILINPKDNSLKVPVLFKSIADISITGTAAHEQLPYNETESTQLSISHTYFVMNHGPSPLEIIDIVLYVPTSFPGASGNAEFLNFTGFESDSGQSQTIAAKCNDTGLVIKPVSNTKKPQGEVFSEFDLIENDGKINETQENEVNKDGGKSGNPEISSRSKKSIEKNISNKKKKFISINCETAQCVAIHCSASPFLSNRKFARITFSAEVNFTVLNNVLEPWYEIEFVTSGEVFIRNSQRDIQPKHHHPDSTRVKTSIVHPGPPPTKEVEKWIIFVSIGVGILLLIIILVALIKIGFFRRQQMEKMRQMMTQPNEEKDPYLIDESETGEGDISKEK